MTSHHAFFIATALFCAGCEVDSIDISSEGLPVALKDYEFKTIRAHNWCVSTENYAACVLEISAQNDAYEGEAVSLELNLLPVQGQSNLNLVPTGYPPLTLAITDDIQGVNPTYNWTCTYESGTANLVSEPYPNEMLRGDYDIVANCANSIGNLRAEDVRLNGNFEVLILGSAATTPSPAFDE